MFIQPIKTAVPLAHIAAVSMEAVHGNPSPEVIATSTCSSYPCPALVSMELETQNLLGKFRSHFRFSQFPKQSG
jgi:hypothetical protein